MRDGVYTIVKDCYEWIIQRAIAFLPPDGAPRIVFIHIPGLLSKMQNNSRHNIVIIEIYLNLQDLLWWLILLWRGSIYFAPTLNLTIQEIFLHTYYQGPAICSKQLEAVYEDLVVKSLHITACKLQTIAPRWKLWLENYFMLPTEYAMKVLWTYTYSDWRTIKARKYNNLEVSNLPA